MNKLLLTSLLFFICAGSLHSMNLEEKVSDITLPQLYQHFTETLPREIVQDIFSLHLDNNFTELSNNLKNSKALDDFIQHIETSINSCGCLLTTEILKLFFKQKNGSICDIQSIHQETCLHISENPKITQILLQITGEDKDKLLTWQNVDGRTALHYAIIKSNIENIKLLLNTAGNNTYNLLAIEDNYCWTALNVATIFSDNVEIIDFLLDAAGNNAEDLITTYNTAVTSLHFPKFEMRKAILTYMERKNKYKDI